jgi:very-short-patch-repair endonuclease
MSATVTLDAKLRQWKNQLIDTSKRNRLLFFREGKTTTLRLMQPEPDALFDWLVCNERPLTFLLQEPSAGAGAGAAPASGGNAVSGLPPATIARPGEVLTDREDEKLRGTLYNLRLRGRTSVSEQGVNILFVAFGLLEWTSREQSASRGEPLCSPLVLAPVELRRESALDPYRLFPIDEEVVLNPTLAFLLERDYRLTLPQLPENLDQATFEEYCLSVEATTAPQAGWSVRREAYLGTFSFQKLVIYKDLEANADRLRAHPVVRALGGDTGALQEPAPDLPGASDLDRILTPDSTFQVLDADSSQQEAIEAVKRGVTLVLQGPPGTGKSQTIANLVAESIAARRRVLFVSEKMAALQVVFGRLKARGLADFCLEVHSANASKRAVLDELGRVLRLEEGSVPAHSEQALAQLQQLREGLNTYVRQAHAPHGAAGWSPFWVHGQVAALHDEPALNFTFPGPGRVTPEGLARIETLLTRLKAVHPVLSGYTAHPWRGCRISEFTLQRQQDLGEQLAALSAALGRLAETAGELAGRCSLAPPETLAGVDWLLQAAELVAATPRPPDRWLRGADLQALAQHARDYRDRFAGYHHRRSEFLARYREPLLSLPLEALGTKLTEEHGPLLRCFGREDLQPRELLWDQAAALEPPLEDAWSRLSALPEPLEALSRHVGIPVEPTANGAARLCSLTALAAQDPRPTTEWFERGRLRAIRERAVLARETYSALAEKRARLLERYDPGILQLDLDTLVRRFGAEYSTPFRLLRLGYWRDLRTLRGLLRMPGKLSPAQALADLRLAREVQELTAWIQQNEAHLDRELGTWFDGPDTAWDRVMAALDTVRDLLAGFGQASPPPALVDLLVRSDAGLRTLQALHGSACGIAAQAAGALDRLFTYLHPERLPFGSTMLQDVELSRLTPWLGLLRAACSDFWEAREQVLRHTSDPAGLGWRQAAADLDRGARLQQEAAALEQLSPTLEAEYGHLFTGLATDWEQVLRALAWAGTLADHFAGRELPDPLIRLVAQGGEPLAPVLSSLPAAREARARAGSETEALAALFEPGTLIGEELNETPLSGFLLRAERLRANLSALEAWVDFAHVRRDCEAAGLGSFVEALLVHCPPPDGLRPAFYRRFYRLWLDDIYAEDRVLHEFRGQHHQTLIEQFRELDRMQWEKLGPARVRERALQGRPKLGVVSPRGSEPAILQRELEKRRRHKPLRQLFAEIPNLLRSLKPCLLMSPMTVSQLLDPAKFSFDLIIFDEASQICSEDAVGAIYRGEQLVVVGDKRQLPPTRFFVAGAVEDFDSPEEEEAAEEEVFESILDECSALGLPTKMLRWHYRSRHESLIAFSNAKIYSQDGGLITFPSAQDEGPALGVEFVHVPEGVYDRRATRRNVEEARRAAELVFQHMTHSPERSLGVVAFSEAQQMAILAEVEALRRVHPELEPMFDEKRPEPFFVKNLENVQGDERDVIFLCVGYGKDAAGSMSLNFGPLNRQGGERRLNVAVTRARLHLKLISSITARDIDLTRTQSLGAHLLHAYLDYAERGPEALQFETSASSKGGPERDAESPFEEAVGTALEVRGHRVVKQVGCGGYRIDLGILDPEAPGRYLLGVECDGATYHSSPTARDRDRLRQSILEGLGWTIHRVWSPDWVKDPERELLGIEAALERAKQRPAPPPESTPASDPAPPVPQPEAGIPTESLDEEAAVEAEAGEAEVSPAAPPGAAAYLRAGLPLMGSPEEFYYADAEILDALKQLAAEEGPVHLRVAARRIAQAWGMQRAGSRIQERVESLAAEGERRGEFRVLDGFLWDSGMVTPPVRRPEDPEDSRSIEEVCLEEIEEAALLVMRQALSMPTAELVLQTARLLGYDRAGRQIRDRVSLAIDRLIQAGKLASDGPSVSLR